MLIVPGTRLNHYEISAPLGAGGMGEIWLAQDLRLERQVALKLLPAQFTSDHERLRRFEIEAKAASALNHPNIITIYEIGEVDGVHFIATEFIDGHTLRERIVQSPLRLIEAVDVAIQVASALAAAHAAGIVHRDIKPENVMLRRDGYVKVLDFGLARVTEVSKPSSDPEAQTLVAQFKTDPGRVMGTVSYMSPEQARGAEVDGRSDIWSLGVMFYEMVSGRLPFRGDSVNDTFAAILREEPPPLSTLVRELPPECNWIISKALARNREDRYQTIKSLLSDLKRLRQRLDFEAEMERTVLARLRGNVTIMDSGSYSVALPSQGHAQPGAAAQAARITRPVSSAEYLLSEFRQHRRSVLALLVLLLLGVSSLAWYALRPRPIESLAVLPFINASGDAETERLSESLTERVIISLSQVPNLKVRSLTAVSRYKGRQHETGMIAKELGVQALLIGKVGRGNDGPAIHVELVDAKENNQLWGSQYERLADIQIAQQRIARDVMANLRLAALSGPEREKQKARELYEQGRSNWNRRTVDGLRQGIEYFQQAIEADPDYALAHAGLADCYNMLANYNALPPREAFPKAREAATRALQLDNSLAEAHTALAFAAFIYDWDWEGAEREFKKAIELNPKYAPAWQWYASYLAVTGRHDEALAAAGKAKELDPLSLIVNAHLGRMLYYAGRYDEAIEQFQKTLALDPKFFAARRYIGQAYEEMGRYDDAIRELNQAVKLSGGGALVRGELGHAYAAAGRKEEARRIIAELRTASSQQGLSFLIAVIYAGLGEKDEAFEALEQAYAEKADRMAYLQVDPRLKNLRSDPRYTDLLQRIGLTP
ncbi:MAG TPA: protein kinase [Blastocatellia bacterium]|nr:protein kinase [Blastocatellia bacterium]